MNVTVIIPVGPKHETLAVRAVASVRAAWARDKGPFTEMRLVTVLDPWGELGRSCARNIGMDDNPSDWYFLMDADDRMMPSAFSLVNRSFVATFGAVFIDGRRHRRNRWPLDWLKLIRWGADGTLSMGFFMRGDLGLRFDETMDVGEDFDLYARLPNFTKVEDPLVNIDYQAPSAGGPRSSRDTDWHKACRAALDKHCSVVIDKHVNR